MIRLAVAVVLADRGGVVGARAEAAASSAADRVSHGRRRSLTWHRHAPQCTGLAGSRTRNVAPRPSPSLSARTDPPCSSTRCLTIASPSPRPPCRRVVPGVLLAEALEHVRQERRRDARAGVADHDLDVAAGAAQPHAHPPPVGVNLTAFDSRFQTTCCRRSGSPADHAHVRLDAGRRPECSSRRPPAARSRPRRRRPRSSIDAVGRRGAACRHIARETSSRSSISWVCARALRSMTSQRRRRAVALDLRRSRACAPSRGSR